MLKVVDIEYYKLEDVTFISPLNVTSQRIAIVTKSCINEIASNLLNTSNWFESDFYSAVSSIVFFPIKLDLEIVNNIPGGIIPGDTNPPLFDNIVINKQGLSSKGFWFTGFTLRYELCRFNLPHHFNNFLDLENYTKVILRLPYIEDVLIPQSKFNTQIIVYFSLDLGTGGITYYIGTDVYTEDEEPTELFIPILEKRGKCGIQLPLGSSNYHNVNQANLSSILNSVLGGINAFADDNAKQLMNIGGNLLINYALSDLNRIARAGTPVQSLSDIYQLLTPTIETHRPNVPVLEDDTSKSNYYKLNGYPSSSVVRLSSLVHFDNSPYYKYVFKNVDSNWNQDNLFTQAEYLEFISIITSKNGVWIK